MHLVTIHVMPDKFASHQNPLQNLANVFVYNYNFDCVVLMAMSHAFCKMFPIHRKP